MPQQTLLFTGYKPSDPLTFDQRELMAAQDLGTPSD